MLSTMSNRRLGAECAAIFVIFPLLLFFAKPHSWIYVMLWAMSLAAYAVLRLHYGYRFRADWNAGALTKPVLKAMALRALPLAAALFIFTLLNVPQRLFSLPLEHPDRWALVMLLYPVLSATPQEILFRSFFFRRYGALFPAHTLTAASALAFGWAHIVLHNWVAVTFCAAGGFIFARTYEKTKSLAAASLEHALYGCWVFTLGLGVYFYHGLAVT